MSLTLVSRLVVLIIAVSVGSLLLIGNAEPWAAPLRKIDNESLSSLASLAGSRHLLLPSEASSTTKEFAPFLKSSPLLFSDIRITADEAGIFEQTPPSPIDMALLLSLLRKAGAKIVVLDHPLTWDSLDTIGNSLLELELTKIPRAVVGFPLSRASTPSDIPAAWHASSLASSAFPNAPASIPVVNRVPVTVATYGSAKTLVGFSTLENEPLTDGQPHLIARWGDRLVLSTLVLALLSDLDLSLNDITLSGNRLSLGTFNYAIPLDPFGRLSLTQTSQKPSPFVAAENIVAPHSNESSVSPEKMVFLSDESTPQADNLRLVSRSPRLGEPQTLTRLSLASHIGLLGALAAAIVFIRNPRRMLLAWPRLLLFVVVAAVASLVSLAALSQGTWLSAVALISTVLTAQILPFVRGAEQI